MTLNDRAQLTLVDATRREHGEHALGADRPHEHEAGIVVDDELAQLRAPTHRRELAGEADSGGEHGRMRCFVGHRRTTGQAEAVDRREDRAVHAVDLLAEIVEYGDRFDRNCRQS